jgi:hypothetical protein
LVVVAVTLSGGLGTDDGVTTGVGVDEGLSPFAFVATTEKV